MARAKMELVIVSETEHTHDQEGEELRCEVCHKKIGYMATFYRWRQLVVGPECIAHAKEDGKKVRGTEKLRKVVRELFLQRKREDTIRGMKAGGWLK